MLGMEAGGAGTQIPHWQRLLEDQPIDLRRHH